MKHTFRTLLGLVLVVFVLAGCSNPAGPEFSEIPEDNTRLVKVEFEWCTYHKNHKNTDGVKTYAPMYLLDLHWDSELKSYAYGFPGDYDLDSYSKLLYDEERFNEFSKDAFEKVFGTKYYEEGTIVDLKKWTSEAARLSSTGVDVGFRDKLCFLTEDIDSIKSLETKKTFEEIEVGNEDIKIYVFFDFAKSKSN